MDLRLVDASVSQHHATIHEKEGVYTVTDRGSRNGSFIGGVQLVPSSPRIIRSGDLLRVGRIWLEVKLGEKQDEAPLSAAMATRELALALVSRAMKVDAPSVRVVEGPDMGATLKLADDGRQYVVGRGDACDWMLRDPDVSRTHLEIGRRGATITIRNLGARNSVFAGKVEIAAGADTVWRGSSMVRLGKTVLALEEPIERAILEIGALEEQAADVTSEAVPPAVVEAASLPASAEAPRSTNGGAEDTATAAPIALVAPEAPIPAKRSKPHRVQDVIIVAGTALVLVLAVAVLVWLLKG